MLTGFLKCTLYDTITLRIFTDYRLVIVCSKEGEDKSHIVSKLLLYKKSIVLKHGDKLYQKYLRDHFINRTHGQTISHRASVVDREK